MKTFGKLFSVVLVLAFVVSFSMESSAACKLDAAGAGKCHGIIDLDDDGDVSLSLKCEKPVPNDTGVNCKLPTKPVIVA